MLAIARRCKIFGWPSSTFRKRLMKDKRTAVKILICWCADHGEHGTEMNDLFVCRPLRKHTWNEEIVDVQTLKITDLKLLSCWCADRFNIWLVCRPWRTQIWNYWFVVCRPWRTHIWYYWLAGDVQTLENTDLKLLIGWCADPEEHGYKITDWLVMCRPWRTQTSLMCGPCSPRWCTLCAWSTHTLPTTTQPLEL